MVHGVPRMGTCGSNVQVIQQASDHDLIGWYLVFEDYLSLASPHPLSIYMSRRWGIALPRRPNTLSCFGLRVVCWHTTSTDTRDKAGWTVKMLPVVVARASREPRSANKIASVSCWSQEQGICKTQLACHRKRLAALSNHVCFDPDTS